MRIFTFFTFFVAAILSISSCQKEIPAVENLKKSCLYDDKVDYFKKWANTYTEINTFSNNNSVTLKDTIYPIGYFQLKSNSTYDVLSNNVPLSGKWDVNDSCKLVLDQGSLLERKFDVLKLTNDSLTLGRKDGNKMYIQHYIAYNCPEKARLQYRWDNTTTNIEHYDFSGVYFTETINPNGFFTLNADGTYNRISDGVSLDGAWQIDSECRLVLDKGTSLERAFDIQKLTDTKLVIWRKDAVNNLNYLQEYVKH